MAPRSGFTAMAVHFAGMVSLAHADCMLWTEVEAKGWTCGGSYSSSCSCPQGTDQDFCIYGGTPYYHCKSIANGAGASKFGIAETAGCTCTEECRPNEWCYAECGGWGWDYCIAPGGQHGGGCTTHGKSVGQFIADFVKSKEGQKVTSHAQPLSTQCWDLARRAMEEALNAGYEISHGPSSYAWSYTTVSAEQAQPGDILQFQGWREDRPGRGWISAWNPHTAVVVEPYDAASGAIPAMDQNPDPVHSTRYHPKWRTSGAVTVYRIADECSNSRLFSTDLPKLLSAARRNSIAAWGAACACGALALAAVAVRRGWLHSRRSGADEARALVEVEAGGEAPDQQ